VPRSASLPVRAMFAVLRGLLVMVVLLVAFVAGGFVIVPLAILAPPIPVILGGLLALYVLGATSSMAGDRQAGRHRRPRAPEPRAPGVRRRSPGLSWPADARVKRPPGSARPPV
jgi:hypothetical protein